MEALIQIEPGDRKLLDSIAVRLAEAARRSGEWLVCRPGCTECCLGPFDITQLDALRLCRGLEALEAVDPERAARVRERAATYVAAMAMDCPGEPATGEPRDEGSLPSALDDMACPALDPQTGLCDLYAARPITCRVFGPVTRIGEATFAACELCYLGATDEETARCAVALDPDGVEGELVAALEAAGLSGITTVAQALAAL